MIAVGIAALLPVLAADGIMLEAYDTTLAQGVLQPEDSVQLNAPTLA